MVFMCVHILNHMTDRSVGRIWNHFSFHRQPFLYPIKSFTETAIFPFTIVPGLPRASKQTVQWIKWLRVWWSLIIDILYIDIGLTWGRASACGEMLVRWVNTRGLKHNLRPANSCFCYLQCSIERLLRMFFRLFILLLFKTRWLISKKMKLIGITWISCQLKEK